MKNKQIAYITAFIPFGKIESFVLEEICSVRKLCNNVLIVPRNPPQEVFHEKAKELVSSTIGMPLLNGVIIFRFLCALISMRVWKIMGVVFKESRNFKTLVKNFIIFPKSVYLAKILKEQNVEHIHAHWASTTTTMAYIIHRLTGIPYSFTLHRWDIYENSMLEEKVRMANFARCISIAGKNDVLTIIGKQLENKVRMIHMGVEVPEVIHHVKRERQETILMTPANLLPVKGHRYMIEACNLLKSKGIKVKYWIVGGGLLEKDLKQQVQEAMLEDAVMFLGRLPHDQVLEMYRKRLVDVVVLPSIYAGDNIHEGIPVALMEAMSYEIPVLSTETGSIPELISDGSGIIVKDKDAAALANSVEMLIKDKSFYKQVAMRGREKVLNEFSENKISRNLVELFESNAKQEYLL